MILRKLVELPDDIIICLFTSIFCPINFSMSCMRFRNIFIKLLTLEKLYKFTNDSKKNQRDENYWWKVFWSSNYIITRIDSDKHYFYPVYSLTLTVLNEYPIYGNLSLPIEHRCTKCSNLVNNMTISCDDDCNCYVIRLGVINKRDCYLPLSIMFSNHYCHEIFDDKYSHIDLSHFTEVIVLSRRKDYSDLKKILRQIIIKIIQNHYYSNIINEF